MDSSNIDPFDPFGNPEEQDLPQLRQIGKQISVCEHNAQIEKIEPPTPEEQQDLGDVEWYTRFLPEYEKRLDIIHFNDVYDIEGRMPTMNPNDVVAGVPRFKRAFDLYRSNEKLVLFSGDLLFPSTLSTHFFGEQMIVPFNALNVDVSCVGNHEVDMGIEHAKQLLKKTNCPWILSNLVEKDTGDQFCKVKPYHVLEKDGFKIGFLGFAEKEWLDQFKPEIDITVLEYIDFNESLRKYSQILKNEHNCDLVFALNHVRVPDDVKMAKENNSPDVLDAIFGGHDHTYFRELNQETGVYIIKSGSDFEDFSNLVMLFGVSPESHQAYCEKLNQRALELNYDRNLIQVCYDERQKRMQVSERVRITVRFAPDFEIAQHVYQYAAEIKKKLVQEAGCCGVMLEARFSRIRTEETNLGNFIADLIRTHWGTDIGLTNGGGLRANQVIPKGPITWRLINQILPMYDPVIKIQMKGSLIKEVLENAVGAWPKMDGRWPVTSGFSFKFDPSRQKGERIIPESMVMMDGTKFHFDKSYTLAVTQYMASGKDGFEAFLDPSVQLISKDYEDEDIRNILSEFLYKLQKSEEDLNADSKHMQHIFQQRMEVFNTDITRRCCESKCIKFYPKIEGRIVNLAPPIVHND